jgi:hypothetical protein
MSRATVELKVRVILVTTRAALRHAGDDPAERRAVVLRGRELLDALAAETLDGEGAHVASARREMERLLDR